MHHKADHFCKEFRLEKGSCNFVIETELGICLNPTTFEVLTEIKSTLSPVHSLTKPIFFYIHHASFMHQQKMNSFSFLFCMIQDMEPEEFLI